MVPPRRINGGTEGQRRWGNDRPDLVVLDADLPDLVVLDADLPDISGLDIVTRIRPLRDGARPRLKLR